jgi:hypothetical protein
MPAWAQEPSSAPTGRVRITGVKTYEIPGVIKLEGDRWSGSPVRVTEQFVQFRRPGDNRLLTVPRPGKRLTGSSRTIGDGLVEFVLQGENEPLFVPQDAIAKTESLERPAATTFRELAVVAGSGLRVVVTTTDARRVRGRIDSIDESRLLLSTGATAREFSEADIREVRQRGDRLTDGALKGAGAGALVASGFLVTGGHSGCNAAEPGEAGLCFLAALAIFAPIGILVGVTVDAAMPHDLLLYARPQAQSRRWILEPLFSAHGYGVRVAMAF